jgi:phosphatidylinositol glycan class F
LLIQFRIQHSIISLFQTTISVPLLFIIQILLGAPLTTHIAHTLLSSTHLALLGVFPLIYVHGIDSSKWLEILSAQSPFDEVFGAAVGACVGAWLGAVPIPLDWDREWQKWPVTVVTGMYGGYVVGKGVGGWLVRGRRIEFD